MRSKEKIAIILAAGKGKRLSIFEIPKPLVRLGNKPLIMHTIDRFKEIGVNKFYIVIEPQDRLIKRELINYDNIIYVESSCNKRGMLDSVLSVKDIVKNEIKSEFYLSVCDLFFEQNPLYSFDKYKHGGISVLISTNKDINTYTGANEIVVLHKDNSLNYDIRDNKETILEVGIYKFKPKAYLEFAALAKGAKKMRDALHYYSQKNKLYPFDVKDVVWFDINTPIDLVRAELFLKNNKNNNKIQQIQNVKTFNYKRIRPSVVYKYDKTLKFEVIIKRGIINSIREYEIIPHESYYSPHYILADKNIDKLYVDKIFQQFLEQGYKINKILVDPGESTKSIEVYARLANEMVSSGIDKKSIIISIGGGVVKDLAGFLASTIYRGIGFISFPTTVLSQSDAAIALKQGVNGYLGKNLFGSYYSPLKVILDPETLLTLEERYIYDGLSECLKQSFAQDKKFFDFLKKYQGEVKNIDFLEKVVSWAAKLKVDSISKDYNEENIALVNQYGHEFGHAIEHLSGYTLLHGESVAVGMRISAELSNLLGVANRNVVEEQINLLQKYCLPVCIPRNIKPEDILHSLKFSKKFHGEKPRFVLVDKIGSLWHEGDYYFATCEEDIILEAIKKSYEIRDN